MRVRLGTGRLLFNQVRPGLYIYSTVLVQTFPNFYALLHWSQSLYFSTYTKASKDLSKNYRGNK